MSSQNPNPNQSFTLGLNLPNEITCVKPSGQFNELLTVNQLNEHLKNELKGIQIHEQKFKPSFILYILEKVKTIILNNKSFNKDELKDLTNQTLKLLIPGITDQDLKIIDDIMDTLITNKLVQAIDNSITGKIKSFLKKDIF